MTRFLIGAGLLIVGGLALLTSEQAARWQSDRTLWCHAVTVTPDKPRALNNCAIALMRVGRSDRAVPLLEHALAMNADPRRPGERFRNAITVNLALALVAVQRQDEARRVFARVDHTYPGWTRVAWLQ